MTRYNVYLFGSGIMKVEEVTSWETTNTLIPAHDITNVSRDYDVVRVQTVTRNYRFDCLTRSRAEDLYDQISTIWHSLAPRRIETVVVHHQPVVRRTVVVEERRYPSEAEVYGRVVGSLLGLMEQGLRAYNDSKKNQPKYIGRGVKK